MPTESALNFQWLNKLGNWGLLEYINFLFFQNWMDNCNTIKHKQKMASLWYEVLLITSYFEYHFEE